MNQFGSSPEENQRLKRKVDEYSENGEEKKNELKKIGETGGNYKRTRRGSRVYSPEYNPNSEYGEKKKEIDLKIKENKEKIGIFEDKIGSKEIEIKSKEIELDQISNGSSESFGLNEEMQLLREKDQLNSSPFQLNRVYSPEYNPNSEYGEKKKKIDLKIKENKEKIGTKEIEIKSKEIEIKSKEIEIKSKEIELDQISNGSSESFGLYEEMQLLREKDQLNREKDQLNREKDELNREKDELNQEKDQLHEEKDQLRKKLKNLGVSAKYSVSFWFSSSVHTKLQRMLRFVGTTESMADAIGDFVTFVKQFSLKVFHNTTNFPNENCVFEEVVSNYNLFSNYVEYQTRDTLFVVSWGETYLDDQNIVRAGHSPKELKSSRFNIATFKMTSYENVGDFNKALNDLNDEMKSMKSAPDRIEHIWSWIDIPFKGEGLLKQFMKYIGKLVQWNVNDPNYTKFSPYGTLIQSSGTGKTKLLVEFHQRCHNELKDSKLFGYKIKPHYIYCGGKESAEKLNDNEIKEVLEEYFLNVNPLGDTEEERRKDFCSYLYSYCNKKFKQYGTSKSEKVCLVLMFDEAQALMKRDGFLFRVIRWVLKESQFNQNGRKVVGLFTATNTSIANLYKETAKTGGNSRNCKLSDLIGPESISSSSHIYPPFVSLSNHNIYDIDEEKKRLTYEEKAVADYSVSRGNLSLKNLKCGRPLFFVMGLHGSFAQKNDNGFFVRDSENNLVLKSFEHKLAVYCNTFEKLYKRISDLDWSCETVGVKREVCSDLFNILSTRCFLGEVEMNVASELVCHSYIFLHDFNHIDKVARLHYPIEPFISNMCSKYMRNIVKHDCDNNQCEICHRFKNNKILWWLYISSLLKSSDFCKRSDGDCGEKFASLHLVNILDQIIAEHKPEIYGNQIDEINISLKSFLEKLGVPKPHFNHGWIEKATISSKQFKRSYIRRDIHHYFNEKLLEYMYDSLAGYLVYEGMGEIDMVISGRYKENENESYFPIFVQVKKYSKMDNGAKLDLLAKFKEMHEKSGKENKFIYLLLVYELEAEEGQNNFFYCNEDGSLECRYHPTRDDRKRILTELNDQNSKKEHIYTCVDRHEKEVTYAIHGFYNPNELNEMKMELSEARMLQTELKENKNFAETLRKKKLLRSANVVPKSVQKRSNSYLNDHFSQLDKITNFDVIERELNEN